LRHEKSQFDAVDRRGRISVFEPALRETPSTNLQTPENFQISNTKPKGRCWGRRGAGRFLSLKLGASLELGLWDSELVPWALIFSKIRMRPIPGCLTKPTCIAHIGP
jgi:hypothetical protein